MYSRGEAIWMMVWSLVAGTGLGMAITSIIAQKELDKTCKVAYNAGFSHGKILKGLENLNEKLNKDKTDTDSTDKGEETES